jgi:hypothetical protein
VDAQLRGHLEFFLSALGGAAIVKTDGSKSS